MNHGVFEWLSTAANLSQAPIPSETKHQSQPRTVTIPRDCLATGLHHSMSARAAAGPVHAIDIGNEHQRVSSFHFISRRRQHLRVMDRHAAFLSALHFSTPHFIYTHCGRETARWGGEGDERQHLINIVKNILITTNFNRILLALIAPISANFKNT